MTGTTYGSFIKIWKLTNKGWSKNSYFNYNFSTLFRKKKKEGKEWTFQPNVKKYRDRLNDSSYKTVYDSTGVHEHVERQLQAFLERMEKKKIMEKGTTIPANGRHKKYFY